MIDLTGKTVLITGANGTVISTVLPVRSIILTPPRDAGPTA